LTEKNLFIYLFFFFLDVHSNFIHKQLKWKQSKHLLFFCGTGV
jgi:hypothetical protein